MRKGRRDRRFGRRSRLTARSDHPLLAVGLKVADDLGNDADQLAGDVGDVLLRQLSLLSAPGLLTPAHLSAPAGAISKRAKGRLTAELSVLLSIGRLAQSETAASILLAALRTESSRSPLLRTELAEWRTM